MRPEEHFERVKANTDQLALVISEAPVAQSGPWVKPCLTPGPYSLRRPTPKNPWRLEVLTCTRPESHGGLFHQYATRDGVVLAQWRRDGRPDYPPQLTPRREDGTDVSV